MIDIDEIPKKNLQNCPRNFTKKLTMQCLPSKVIRLPNMTLINVSQVGLKILQICCLQIYDNGGEKLNLDTKDL